MLWFMSSRTLHCDYNTVFLESDFHPSSEFFTIFFSTRFSITFEWLKPHMSDTHMEACRKHFWMRWFHSADIILVHFWLGASERGFVYIASNGLWRRGNSLKYKTTEGRWWCSWVWGGGRQRNPLIKRLFPFPL